MSTRYHVDNGPERVLARVDCPDCFASNSYVIKENDVWHFESCNRCGYGDPENDELLDDVS